MNPGRQQSQRKQVKTALERIDLLEKGMERMAMLFDMVINQANQRISVVSETVEALSKITGPEAVAQVIVEDRKRKSEEAAAAAKKALDEAVAAGNLVAVETCSEKSLIIGVEKDKDGNLVGPERFQLHFSQIKPEFQEQLLGKGLGTKLTTETGGSVEVLELYDPVEKTEEPKPEDEAQAAEDVAAKLAELAPPTDKG